jgi:imidazolonepropionase-like amidohydrolase
MSLVLKNGKLIDGTGKVVTNAVVLIRGSTITAAGPAAAVPIPEGDNNQVIDLAGMTIMPGLMDLHVHFHEEGSADRFPHDVVGETKTLLLETDAYIAAQMAENARRTLEAGFTTVRDTGGTRDINIDLSRAIADGLVTGPRVIPTATIDMTMPAGKYRTHGLEGGDITGPVEARRAVREKIGRGAEVIHVRATGAGFGQWGAEDQLLTLEEMQAAVGEAHRLGKRTTANACGSKGMKDAVIAGVQCIEHGSLLYEDDELVKMMVDCRVGWVPTFMVSIMKKNHFQEAMARGGRVPIPDYVVERESQMVEACRLSFEKAMAAGIMVGMGTDMGAPYMIHGQNAIEIEQFVKYGATPMQAIEAATRVAAEIMRMEDRLGTVEPKKQADIIVVKEDPLKDIRVLQEVENILLVIKAGKITVDRRRRPTIS